MSLRFVAATLLLFGTLNCAEAQQTRRFQVFPDFRDLDAEEERAEREMRAITMVKDPKASLERFLVHLMLIQVSVLTPLQCESTRGLLEARAEEWRAINLEFFSRADALQKASCPTD